MKINNKPVTGSQFAYDGCHKIYILETEENVIEARNEGFDIYPIEKIQEIYSGSCPLKFIDNWNLNNKYVPQCVQAVFND